MSVKTPASWSAHALRTCPGIPSGGLVIVNLKNVLRTSTMESEITQLFGKGFPTRHNVLFLEASIKGI